MWGKVSIIDGNETGSRFNHYWVELRKADDPSKSGIGEILAQSQDEVIRTLKQEAPEMVIEKITLEIGN